MTHIIISFSKFFLFVSKYLSLYLFSVNSFYLSVTCMMECSQSHLNINDYIQRGEDIGYEVITIKFYKLKL